MTNRYPAHDCVRDGLRARLGVVAAMLALAGLTHCGGADDAAEDPAGASGASAGSGGSIAGAAGAAGAGSSQGGASGASGAGTKGGGAGTSGGGGSAAGASGAGGAAGTSGGGAGASGTAGAAGKAGAGGQADPCAGRLFCTDFEGEDVGSKLKSPWKVSTNKGTVSVVDTKARSGKKSVKVTTEAGSYQRAFFYLDGAPAFPVPGNVVYGRMMIYMDATANDGVHWTMAQGSGPLSGYAGVTSHYRYGGMHKGQMMANYETSGGKATDCWNNSTTKMPTGAWTCMEWKMDGPQNELRFWLDGTEVPDLHVKDKGQGCIAHDLGDAWLAPTFQQMYFGWESYQKDDARVAWVDDVIVDDAPIGCPQ